MLVGARKGVIGARIRVLGVRIEMLRATIGAAIRLSSDTVGARIGVIWEPE